MQIAQPEEIEIAVVVNLEVLRGVLKNLSRGGTRFWIASDPADSLDTGSITVARGYPGCKDQLNATYFRIPILNDEMPRRGTNRLVLLLAPSEIRPDDRGSRMDSGQLSTSDILSDFQEFLTPIKGAIVDLLRAAD